MLHVTIDDRQVRQFLRESPRRGRWALGTALSMAGGHFRKRLADFIRRGAEGWPPVRQMTREARKSREGLRWFGRLVRFKYTGGRQQKVKIGFLPIRGNRGFREGSKTVSIPMVAKRHELGYRRRVTDEMRQYWAARGWPIRKSTKYLTIPARPMIAPFFRRHGREIGPYIEKRFYQKFFSREKPGIKY